MWLFGLRISFPNSVFGYSKTDRLHSESEDKSLTSKENPKRVSKEKAWKRRICNKRKKGKSVKRSPSSYLSAKKNSLEEGSAEKESRKECEQIWTKKKLSEELRRFEDWSEFPKVSEFLLTLSHWNKFFILPWP